MITLIIPVHNEEEGLAYILPYLVINNNITEIIVVNDASTDNSEQVALGFDKVKVVNRPELLGLASALRTGVGHTNNTYIAVMDGDGQHNPHHMNLLIDTFIGKGHKFITGANSVYGIFIGSRFLHKKGFEGLTFSRKIFSKALTFIIRKIGGVSQSTDPLTGMFLCHRMYITNTSIAGYKILLQILIRNKHAPIQEIPIVLEARVGGESKATIKELFRVLQLCITK